MLHYLSTLLADQIGPLNLFRYITFRSGGAVVTALIVSFVCGPGIIRWLRSRQPGPICATAMSGQCCSSPAASA